MAITFRFVEPSDAAGILAIYGPFCETSHVSFETIAPTLEQMSQRIRTVTEKYPWLACEIDGQLAGYVYASQHRERAAYRWAVDVAVYVAEAHCRRGVGRALYNALFLVLREQGIFNAFAGITLPNPASIGLHRAVGFVPVGICHHAGYKLGSWRDVGWWQLSLQPERSDPPETRRIADVRGSDSVAAALLEGAAALGRGTILPSPSADV